MVLDRGFEPAVFDVRGRLPKPTRRLEHIGQATTFKFPKFTLEISIGSLWYSVGGSNSCLRLEGPAS